MQQKPILAFDCDGVLSHLIPVMSKMCQDVSGKECHPLDWVEYEHYLNLGMSAETYLQGMVMHRVLETAEAHDGVASAIQRAVDHGWEIAVITARGFHPNAEQVTREWLRRHEIHVDHLILVGANESKLEALKSLPNVIAYVDDYLRHMDNLSQSFLGIPLFLMDQPWNRHDTSYARVRSVSEFVDRAVALLERQ